MTPVITSRDLPEYREMCFMDPKILEEGAKHIDTLSDRILTMVDGSGYPFEMVLESLVDVVAEYFVRNRCIGTLKDTHEFAEEVHERIWDFIDGEEMEDMQDVFSQRILRIGAYRESMKQEAERRMESGDSFVYDDDYEDDDSEDDWTEDCGCGGSAPKVMLQIVVSDHEGESEGADEDDARTL